MERRLAAILAADVVGYSRLMEADEEATALTLSAYRQIIEGLVESHHGRAYGAAWRGKKTSRKTMRQAGYCNCLIVLMQIEYSFCITMRLGARKGSD